MSPSIEQDIKGQFAKYFETNDWRTFKKAGEYYLENAARIVTNDIRYEVKPFKLLRRNTQKRLYIGIACELLLKSLFLKNGYCINKPKGNITEKYPYLLSRIRKDDFDINDTWGFDRLMQGVYEICDFGSDKPIVDRGFRIAKVFRNKEGHVAVLFHDYKAQNYRDIEKALTAFYRSAFLENLKIKFSVGRNEEAEFEIKNIH